LDNYLVKKDATEPSPVTFWYYLDYGDKVAGGLE